MALSRKDEMFIDMVVMAKELFDSLTEEEIQRDYGSDYHSELKEYLTHGAMQDWRKWTGRE